MNLAYSTYLGARMNMAVERSLQAEYLLKSALEVARLLIRADRLADDSIEDPWRFFYEGAAIPPTLIGLNIPNLTLELEIRPEEAKIPVFGLVPGGGTPNPLWLGIFTRLFQNLGFDDDGEEDVTGLLPRKDFDAVATVAVLVDYLDADKSSYDNTPYRGIEESLPEGVFPPSGGITRFDELQGVPGFTPRRLQQLRPLLTVPIQRASVSSQVNINFAPREVLRALHPGITDSMVDAIIECRKREPFTRGGAPGDSLEVQLSNCGMPTDIYRDLQTAISTTSTLFQIIAKVDYTTARYMLRAYVQRSASFGATPDLPQILSLEIF